LETNLDSSFALRVGELCGEKLLITEIAKKGRKVAEKAAEVAEKGLIVSNDSILL
jgi:hypothetical protein